MFPVKPEHVRRVSFATRVFPKIKSTLGLDTSKLKSSNQFDGELFCGGRSRNKDLLSFFGFIAESRSSPTFVQLPLFRRCLKKLINLVERELETIGAHEILLPTLISQKLWQQSGRLERQQDALDYVYSFTDKAKNKLLLGPTFEESVTQLVADLEPPKESELPLMFYQTSQKFRFEPNPRFGVLRSNEFLMNDLYSFDSTLDKAKQTYEMISRVYETIFKRLDLQCFRFESGTGNIGGKYSHEYQLPVSSGEDTLVHCKNCHYAYNAEMSLHEGVEFKNDQCLRCESTNIDRIQALELGHTFLLSDTYSKPMKVKIARDDGSKANYEMGCYGLGLTRILGAGLDLYSVLPTQNCSDHQSFIQMRWPSGVEPYRIGIVAPAKRSKQYHGGSSEFIERLTNRILDSTNSNIDIILEDRGKEGIFRRVARLQSLGIPYIMIVGQRFLQEIPEIELLKLDQNKVNYEQSWLTEEQICDFARMI